MLAKKAALNLVDQNYLADPTSALMACLLCLSSSAVEYHRVQQQVLLSGPAQACRWSLTELQPVADRTIAVP